MSAISWTSATKDYADKRFGKGDDAEGHEKSDVGEQASCLRIRSAQAIRRIRAYAPVDGIGNAAHNRGDARWKADCPGKRHQIIPQGGQAEQETDEEFVQRRNSEGEEGRDDYKL